MKKNIIVMTIVTREGRCHRYTQPFDGEIKGTKQEAANRALQRFMDYKYISVDTPNGVRAIMKDHIISVSVDILEEEK